MIKPSSAVGYLHAEFCSKAACSGWGGEISRGLSGPARNTYRGLPVNGWTPCPGDQPCLSPEDMPAGPSSSSSSQTCAFPGQRFQLAPLDCCLHGPGGQGSAVEMWHWGFFSANPSVLRNSHDGVTALIIPPEGLGELGTGMLQLCW